MEDNIDKRIEKSALKQGQLSTSALEGSFVFHNGTWWRVELVDSRHGNILTLVEATNTEMMDILNHPGLVVLKNNANS